jgi:hypothetical protein
VTGTRRLILITTLGLLIAACGGSTRTTGLPTRRVISQACPAGRITDPCRRLLGQVAGLHSIPLQTQVPTQVTTSCAGAARMTQIQVVCPPLVPADGVVSDHSLYGPQLVDPNSYSVSINNGQNSGHIHWEFGAGRGPATRLWYFDRSNWDALPPKLPPRRLAQRRYLGYPMTLYRFPDSDGQLEGHNAAFATEDGITYFVSIHGRNHDDADIAMLLAILLARKR